MYLAEGDKGSFLFRFFFFFPGKHLVSYEEHPGQNTQTLMHTEPIVIFKTT